VTPANGLLTKFTAPSNATTATVTAKFRGASVPVPFTVIAPDGVEKAEITSVNHYGVGVAGAGMHLKVTIGPTSVSFYRINIWEEGKDASNISGYFTTHPPASHIGHGANVWHSVGCDNVVGNNFDNAHSFDWPSPWSPGGRYTWDIPAKWRIPGASTNSMTGWNQVHTLEANGTMTIDKFGKTVSRTVNDIVTPNL